jgi:tRNA-2-methylthio-N6-dimethylallyladenosine synthase
MTRRFMEEMAFDSAFVFKYSARPDTPAAGWCDDVPAGEKMRRNRILLEEQEARSLAIRRGLEGAAAEVLVEGVSLRNPLRWSGRTRHNRTAVFRPVGPVRPGDIVRVRVTRATAQTLYGEVEEQGGRSGREAAR